MGAKNVVGLLIAAVFLALVVMSLSDPDAVGYRKCDTHGCVLVTK